MKFWGIMTGVFWFGMLCSWMGKDYPTAIVNGIMLLASCIKELGDKWDN